MPDSCYLAKYVSYLWPTVAADRTRRLSLQDAPCWPCNTPQAEELFLLLSGDTISGATRKAVGEYMVRHSFFEENELRLAEARLLSLAQPPWQRRNVSPANWHEDVYADYRDIVLLFAFVLRDPCTVRPRAARVGARERAVQGAWRRRLRGRRMQRLVVRRGAAVGARRPRGSAAVPLGRGRAAAARAG